MRNFQKRRAKKMDVGQTNKIMANLNTFIELA